MTRNRVVGWDRATDPALPNSLSNVVCSSRALDPEWLQYHHGSFGEVAPFTICSSPFTYLGEFLSGRGYGCKSSLRSGLSAYATYADLLIATKLDHTKVIPEILSGLSFQILSRLVIPGFDPGSRY